MDAPGFNPSLHPRDLVGRWAHVASGDQAAKKLAVATKPKPKSDFNFTGSKETQYHHRHIKPGQMARSRDLKDHQDELYALMRKGMTFDQAKAKVLGEEPVVRASESGPAKKTAPKIYDSFAGIDTTTAVPTHTVPASKLREGMVLVDPETNVPAAGLDHKLRAPTGSGSVSWFVHDFDTNRTLTMNFKPTRAMKVQAK